MRTQSFIEHVQADLRRDSEWYRYQPLNESQVRLVHLHSGEEPSRLQCSLTIHSINDPIDFEALSYTWGDPSSTHWYISDIRVDPDRVLWIDAICINQGDVNERNVQVQLMSRIYKEAVAVAVWLGSPTDDSSIAFELMRQLHKLALETPTQDLDRPLPKGSELLDNLPKTDSLSWKALDALLWRPWFSRAWIIQEIAMSRTATMICGNDTITWIEFLVIIDFLNRRFLTFLVNLDLGVSYLIRDIYMYCRGEAQRPLAALLSMARRSLAGNPVDKVYALLGLATDNPIVPDYRLPVIEVYETVTRSLLMQSLDILSLVGPPRWKAIDGIPSWVVDWSLPLLEHSYIYQNARIFNACGSATEKPKFSSDGKRLIVQGLLFDRVALHGSTNINPNVSSDVAFVGVSSRGMGELWDGALSLTSIRRFRYWERLVLRMKTYPTGEPIESVLHRTMIADNLGTRTDTLAYASLAEHYAAFRRLTALFPGEKMVSQSDNAVMDETFNKVYSAAKNRATLGRRLFTTKTGYVGIGSSATRAGDCVVLLAGGRTAYILREERRSGSYTFLGEAYLHGCMYGDVFAGSRTLQEFEIT